jgi:nucleoid-associated protein YgaU
MRLLRAPLALVLLVAFSGCGYVHFGRLPEATPGDATLTTAYSNLATEHKILKQELVLSRKEGDALRSALDNRGAAAGSPELVARLNETTRELAALRASYAKLQSERTSAPLAPAATIDTARFADLENKLATALRDYTRLQEENARLRTDIDQSRAENTTLTAQVKTATAQNAQAQAALAQLNTELLAQKDARSRAEQQAAANAAQLSAVIARAGAKPATLAEARDRTSTVATTLAPEAKPAAEKQPSFGEPGGTTAELRTNPARVRSTPPSASGTPEAPRIHVVTATDTLEKIAQKYYGDPGRWRTIYFVNNAQLSGGRPLKPGMQLEIPRD